MFVKHFNATLQKFWYFYYAYRRDLLCKARHSSTHARVFSDKSLAFLIIYNSIIRLQFFDAPLPSAYCAPTLSKGEGFFKVEILRLRLRMTKENMPCYKTYLSTYQTIRIAYPSRPPRRFPRLRGKHERPFFPRKQRPPRSFFVIPSVFCVPKDLTFNTSSASEFHVLLFTKHGSWNLYCAQMRACLSSRANALPNVRATGALKTRP